MTDYYWVLNPDHTFRPARDREEGAAQFESDRVVARTEIVRGITKITVSTVFLVIDHSFGSGGPILFETMIFGLPDSESQWRWKTWDEARFGHDFVVGTIVEETDVVTLEATA